MKAVIHNMNNQIAIYCEQAVLMFKLQETSTSIHHWVEVDACDCFSFQGASNEYWKNSWATGTLLGKNVALPHKMAMTVAIASVTNSDNSNNIHYVQQEEWN